MNCAAIRDLGPGRKVAYLEGGNMSVLDYDLGPPMDAPSSEQPVYPIRNKTDLRVIRRRIEATPQGTAEELRPEWERLIDTLRNKLPPAKPSGLEWIGW